MNDPFRTFGNKYPDGVLASVAEEQNPQIIPAALGASTLATPALMLSPSLPMPALKKVSESSEAKLPAGNLLCGANVTRATAPGEWCQLGKFVLEAGTTWSHLMIKDF